MVRSKYKIFGGFGVLIFINLLALAIFLLIAFLDSNSMRSDEKAIALMVTGSMQVFFLIFFMTQCGVLQLDDKSFTRINPLFPLRRSIFTWDSLDYYMPVDEHTRTRTYETIWLVSDQKLRAKISSFYYRNYEELKRNIPLPGKGKQHLSHGQQLLIWLALRPIEAVSQESNGFS